MMIKLFTFINDFPRNAVKVRHYIGLPSELAGEKDTQQNLPIADILLIEENSSGIFLYRYAKTGAFAGDTWHMSIEDAKEQASFEYGTSLGDWRTIPEDVTDALEYLLKVYPT